MRPFTPWRSDLEPMLHRYHDKPVENDYFSLSANGGVARDRVILVLRNPKLVGNAVKRGKCFQCFAVDIDQTGLCFVCRSFLTDEERAVAQVYYESA
jgi:hypothetical protein